MRPLSLVAPELFCNYFVKDPETRIVDLAGVHHLVISSSAPRHPESQAAPDGQMRRPGREGTPVVYQGGTPRDEKNGFIFCNREVILYPKQ